MTVRRPLTWPDRWEHRRVRPGLYLAEGHTIERLEPRGRGWGVWCSNDDYVGSDRTLINAIEVLEEHLRTCVPALFNETREENDR